MNGWRKGGRKRVVVLDLVLLNGNPLLLELPELLDESSPLLDAAELLLLLRASLSSPLIHLDFLAAESHPQ